MFQKLFHCPIHTKNAAHAEQVLNRLIQIFENDAYPFNKKVGCGYEGERFEDVSYTRCQGGIIREWHRTYGGGYLNDLLLCPVCDGTMVKKSKVNTRKMVTDLKVRLCETPYLEQEDAANIIKAVCDEYQVKL